MTTDGKTYKTTTTTFKVFASFLCQEKFLCHFPILNSKQQNMQYIQFQNSNYFLVMIKEHIDVYQDPVDGLESQINTIYMYIYVVLFCECFQFYKIRILVLKASFVLELKLELRIYFSLVRVEGFLVMSCSRTLELVKLKLKLSFTKPQYSDSAYMHNMNRNFKFLVVCHKRLLYVYDKYPGYRQKQYKEMWG